MTEPNKPTNGQVNEQVSNVTESAVNTPDPTRVHNVLMVGVGGQGIVLASNILSEAAMLAGYDVKKSEIHGMSQRGGPVFSHVRFSKSKVQSPTIPKGEADVVYSLERMELLRWAEWARPDGAACYFAEDTLPIGVTEYPEGIDEDVARIFNRVVRLENDDLRAQHVSPKVKNTVLVGAVSALIPIEPAVFAEAIASQCPPGTDEVNITGFELGRAIALESNTAAADKAGSDVE